MTFVAVPPSGTPGTTTGQPPRSPLPVVLAGLVALALAVGAVGAALVALDAGRDGDAARAAGRAASGSHLPDDLIKGLQDERNRGAAFLLGVEADPDSLVTSFPQATAATDKALADFRARLAGQGGAAQRALVPIVDGLGAELIPLRAQVTGVTGERSLRQIDRVLSLDSGYRVQIDRLLSADRSIARAIDDPTLRRGAELLALGSRQGERSATLEREILLLFLADDPASSTDQLRRTADDLGDLRAVGAEIDALATGTFAPAARSTAEDRGALAGPAEEALRGGAPIVQAAGLGDASERGLVAFRTGVAKVIDRHVAAQVDEARGREAAAVIAAVVLAVAALAATAAAIALAVTRRRPTG